MAQNLRLTRYETDKYQVDVHAGFNLIRCTTNHRMNLPGGSAPHPPGLVEPPDEEKDAYRRTRTDDQGRMLVENVSDRLSAAEIMCARLICDLAMRLKNPPKKPKFPLGNKYDPQSFKKVCVWLILDSKEIRLRAFMGHLPYVLVTSCWVADVWFVLSDCSWIMVPERKAWPDMHASTHSGHKKSQVAKMHASRVPPHLFEWWIEGPTSPAFLCGPCYEKHRPEDLDASQALITELASSETNLRVRDGFNVFRTAHLLDTLLTALRRLHGVQMEGPLVRWGSHGTLITPTNVGMFTKEHGGILDWVAEQHRAGAPVNPQLEARLAQQAVAASKKQNLGQGTKAPKASAHDDSAVVLGKLLSVFHGITDATGSDIAAVYRRHRNMIEGWIRIEDDARVDTDAHEGADVTTPVQTSTSRKKDTSIPDKPKKKPRRIQTHSDDDASDEGGETKKGKATKKSKTNSTTSKDDRDEVSLWEESDTKPSKKRKKVVDDNEDMNPEMDPVKKPKRSSKGESDVETEPEPLFKSKANKAKATTKAKAKTGDKDKPNSKAKTKAKTRTKAEPSADQKLVKKLAHMLNKVPRLAAGGDQKTVTDAQSASIWLNLWATEEQRNVWLGHPENKQEKERLRREAKKMRDMASTDTHTPGPDAPDSTFEPDAFGSNGDMGFIPALEDVSTETSTDTMLP